jgi:Xaa-Pro aminopeptidase
MPYANRIKKLQQQITVPYLIEDPISLYYLTGLHLSLGILIVTPNDASLYVDGRYKEMAHARSSVPVFSIEDNPFQHYHELSFDRDATTYKRFQELQEKKLKLIPIDDPVSRLRMIKEPAEQDLLRRAAKLGSTGFHHAVSLLREGVAEAEIAMELEIYWKREGAKGLAFDPIIAFGSNSSMPHYRAGDRRLAKGDIVLIDIGVNLNHYHSDMTRVHFYGTPNPELQKIHGIVFEALQRALKLCRPGTRIGDLDAAARNYIEENGHKLPHSLGHGVGLCVHEAPWLRNKAPWSDAVLEEGMVITIEPGIYVPGLGGVRLEDTILIQKDGYENLTLVEYS